MYVARSTDGRFEATTADLEYALRAAVDRAAHFGVDVEVVKRGDPHAIYYVEVDTKVVETHPTFPVIVHIRPDDRGPEEGLQC